MNKWLTVMLLLFCHISQAQFLDKLTVEMGTELPIQIGIRAHGDINDSFYASAGVGYLPEFYSGMVDTFTLGTTVEASKINSKSIGDSIVIDLRGGWRSKSSTKFYIDGGYTGFIGGKGHADGGMMNDFIDFNKYFLNDDFTVKSNLHSLNVHVGMRYKVSQKMQMAFEAGIIKPLNATVTVEGFADSQFNLDNLARDLGAEWKNAFIMTASAWVVIKL